MDVGVLVGAVVPYLCALAGRYGSAVLERAVQEGTEAGADATFGLGRRLLRRLLSPEVPARDAIEEAVADLGAHPDDEDFQRAVRAQLKKALANDEQLRSDLAELLGGAGGVSVAAVGERSVAAQTISGVVVTGDDAKIKR
ncbi:hypothetical protein [Natronosporangium hydrolyticum]|uniref:hypothetical protein n=1 Tax=Natronosporangium hydrolyticum TaxID=2811111 RepID=UPI001EFA07FF|nr:hypothetical protein [Natronosporangium hydrolyticum]